MNSVSRILLSASICIGLSGVVHAQSATPDTSKPAVAGDHAKHKAPAVEKQKPAAPAEAVTADKAKPTDKTAKPAQPAAAPKADKAAVTKPEGDKPSKEHSAVAPREKAAKPAKAAAKAEPAADATKPAVK